MLGAGRMVPGTVFGPDQVSQPGSGRGHGVTGLFLTWTGQIVESGLIKDTGRTEMDLPPKDTRRT